MLPRTTSYPLAALGFLVGGSYAATTVSTQTITISPTSPATASNVPKDFVGFGFDGQFLDVYNNELSANLIDSVVNRMRLPPIIRVGGTSSDKVKYNKTQEQAVVCIPPKNNNTQCPWGSGTAFSIGPSYFDGFKAFNNTRMTFQVPMGSDPDLKAAVNFAQLAYAALGPNRTAAIAMGNEVEGQGYGKNGKTPTIYIQNASTIEEAILAQVTPKIKDPTIFEVLDMGSQAMDGIREGTHQYWSIPQAFKQGLDQNNTVKYAAAHWYQIDGGHTNQPTLQGSLMNHDAIVRKGIPYVNATNYLQKNFPNVPFVLSETGGVEGTSNSTPDFAPVFGATLWSVDWQLYCMSQGIARIAGSMRPQSHHSLWIPVANVTGSGSKNPEVRAPYYAQPFVADFIGKAAAATTVTEILGHQHYTAYAAYEGGSLARIALVNLVEWSTLNQTTRPNMTYSMVLPKGVQSVQVARLMAEDGAYAGGIDYNQQNITYAGQFWSASRDGRVHPANQTLQNVTVTKNLLQVTLPASEAVIVHIQ